MVGYVSERDVYPYGDGDTESRESYDDVSGTQFTLGVLVERLHRVDVALVYRSGFDLEGDYSLRPSGSTEATTGNFTHEYPDAIGVGFEYHPRNEIMTTLSLDVEYTRWSDFKDSMVDDVELDDTIEYRLGVEHQFYNKSHARFGFAYQPAYFDERTTRTAFSGGLGVDVLGVRLDVAGQIGVRQYDIDLGRVRETTTIAMATVVRTF
jgi:long-subunit fatty acid transport protein